jgi:hypothetical protein
MAKAGISLCLDHQLKLVAKKASIRSDERVVYLESCKSAGTHIFGTSHFTSIGLLPSGTLIFWRSSPVP